MPNKNIHIIPTDITNFFSPFLRINLPRPIICRRSRNFRGVTVNSDSMLKCPKKSWNEEKLKSHAVEYFSKRLTQIALFPNLFDIFVYVSYQAFVGLFQAPFPYATLRLSRQFPTMM